MSRGYLFNIRSKGHGHKMQKHISGNRVAGVSLHSRVTTDQHLVHSRQSSRKLI